jgi:formylglycine-generating enzyme required for sulfatase activity
MKATVLTTCALLLIGMGLVALTARPDCVAAQSVKIEPGKKPTPKPATPTPTPRKPIVSRTPRLSAPKIEMVLVPEGAFLMGSPENEPGRSEDEGLQHRFTQGMSPLRLRSKDEGPQHRVTVRSFYIGKYEVTQAQWRAVMGGDPSAYKGDDLPVENVSWDDAKEFCRRLSQTTGEEYRLPTEAEWEYACRARTTGAFAGDLDAMAWYGANSDGRTHPVGRKRPNAFGLYDMHGNVWEWCEDDWHGSYANATYDGSAWMEPKRNSWRVLRGGGWNVAAASCRSANRYGTSPINRSDFLGIRLVRTYR